MRISPKKIRLVVDVVRGMKVNEAIDQLKYSKKIARVPVLKLLNSAVANAEKNFNLKKDNLYIKKITADGGPILHRWRARAMGRAAPIRKRTTHLSIVLDETVPTEQIKNKKIEAKSAKSQKPVKAAKKKGDVKKK